MGRTANAAADHNYKYQRETVLPPISLDGEEEPASRVEHGEYAAQIQGDSRFHEHLLSEGWPSIGLGIALSGAAYPIVLGVIFLLLVIVIPIVSSGFGTAWRPDQAIETLFGSLMFAGPAAVIGLIWATMVMVPTLPILHLVLWSLNLRIGLVWLGAFSGGLIGFMSVLPIAIIGFQELFDSGSLLGTLALMLAGPGLATIVGQVGGRWGGARGADAIAAKLMVTNIEWLRLKYAIGRGDAADHNNIDGEPAVTNSDASPFQFRIAHLLWIGVWTSILLTVIRLSGIRYELILPVLLVWIAYQATTLSIGLLLVRRLGPWWSKRRQIRST